MRCLTTYASDNAVTKCFSSSAVLRDEEVALLAAHSIHFKSETSLSKNLYEELITYIPVESI